MNSLHKLGAIGKTALFALMIVSILAVAVSAQKVAPQKEGKRYGDAGFMGEPINLNVVNADIRDILNYITEQYGINFVIDKSVKDIPVTVNVSEVPWNMALDSILQSQALGVQVNGPILRVADSKTLADEGIIVQRQKDNQLDTSPLYTEFVRLNYARASGTLTSEAGGSGQTSTGSSNAGGGGGMSGGGMNGSDQGVLGIIKRRLSRRGSVEVDGRSNTLIITDVRENIDAIRQLVTLLDQPEPQVEIEARIVVATRNFSRDVGIQLGAVALGARNSGAIGGTMSPTGSTTLPTNSLPGTIRNPQPNGGLASEIANTVIGLTTGVFGTAQISALITAGEQKGEAKIIATPRVTTLNNRPAEIKSGSKIPVVTVQAGASAGGAAIATTEYVDVPLRLAITPQITDVGTVILNVVAENSSAAATVSGAPPAINTQSMTTQVTVPDGGTTVVGGVLFDDERENKNRTPGLSRIPLLGILFQRKSVQRNTNEILFFITPRIYRPDFEGNPTPGKISNGTRSTTIIQPVPLGNPPSNSDPVLPQTNNNATPLVPIVPSVKPEAAPSSSTKP
ncbi:MAG TPA: type IV pilus secretin PilQ [Pyrinomonadaceae bacterium]|nr:type IV pilus secretin PilQ [Pyrinomonadaceae bacterium]